MRRAVLLLSAAIAGACMPPPRRIEPAGSAWTGSPGPPWGAAVSATSGPPPPSSQTDSDAPRDFAEEVKLLFRIAACGSDDPLPSGIDVGVVQAHCSELETELVPYRAHYLGEAKAFLTALQPPGMPSSVVYPFGGGDLLSALTTFPEAQELTTISLELAGDPRRIHTMTPDQLSESLSHVRATLSGLVGGADYSRSETLKSTQRGDIPGQLAFFLVALAIHGQEPITLRYLTLAPDGSVRYLTGREIDESDRQLASHRKSTWTPPDFSEAFANAELGFRPRGAPGAPLRIHRHLAVNLADDHLEKDPALLRHLERKGRFSAMTKAASYLLWKDSFSKIRACLADHLEFMVSDSTGIPPRFAEQAGLVQETYGAFRRSLLGASAEHNRAFRELWKAQPKRKLPFRYGYLDAAGSPHLLVTRRPAR